MPQLLAALALVAGVVAAKALSDSDDDREWTAFLEVHTELHA